MRVLLQEKNILTHDKSPDRVIDRSVVVVALIDCELKQMLGTTGDGRVVVTDTTFRIHSGTSSIEITYDSFAAPARMFPFDYTHDGSASPKMMETNSPKTQISGGRAASWQRPRRSRSTYRRARITRFVIQAIRTIAITHGARTMRSEEHTSELQ